MPQHSFRIDVSGRFFHASPSVRSSYGGSGGLVFPSASLHFAPSAGLVNVAAETPNGPLFVSAGAMQCFSDPPHRRENHIRGFVENIALQCFSKMNKKQSCNKMCT